MAQFEITALSCGTCHQSGIAAWRSADKEPCRIIFVSAAFLHDTAAAGTVPVFTCAACNGRAVMAPLLT